MEEKIICPICDSGNNLFFCNKNKFKINKCQNCGVAYVLNVPDAFEVIYDEKYFYKKNGKKGFGYTSYDKDKEPMKTIFEKYLRKFENLIDEKTIFDFGAATGCFLDLALKLGWKTNGNEVSKYACQECLKRGHKVFCGDITDIKTDNKYSIVTMWDVLEHLKKPRESLYTVNRIMPVGGYLAINTIDIKSLWAKLLGKRWNQILPPEHLFYFSFNSLKRLLEISGFEIVETKKIGKRFSLSYIFQVLYNWHNFKLWEKLLVYFNKPFWRKFSIPINLRDNIFILSKKIKDV